MKRFFILYIFLTLGAIVSAAPELTDIIPVANDDQTIYQDYSFQMYNREFRTNGMHFVFENISLADLENLSEEMNAKTVDNVDNLALSAVPYPHTRTASYYPISVRYSDKLSVAAEAGYMFLNVYRPVYDSEKSLGRIRFALQLCGDRNLENFTLNDAAIIGNLIDFSRYTMTGYYVTLRYEANGLAIGGTADGDIVIEIMLDASSEITVGDYSSTTDSSGLFRFSGNPSLSRIGEGIIQIIDSNDNVVLARQNIETGNWYVSVTGFDGSDPIEFNVDIDSLNY